MYVCIVVHNAQSSLFARFKLSESKAGFRLHCYKHRGLECATIRWHVALTGLSVLFSYYG